MKYTTPFLLTLLLGLGFLFNACERNEIVPPNNPPVDTTPVDTTPVDTTPVDTTSLIPPPGAFDIVVTRISTGGGGGSISGGMIRLWGASYEIQSTDTVGVSYTWRSSVVAHSPSLNDLFPYNQIANVSYRTSCTDTITVTARRGTHTRVYSKVFVINEVFPTPPPSFDIGLIKYHSIPPTRSDGQAWDPIPMGSDTSAAPELRMQTANFRQVHFFSAAPPTQFMIVRRDSNFPGPNPGTPDYNLTGVTEILLLDWDDATLGHHDTIGMFHFVPNDYKIPGRSRAVVELFGPNNLHIELLLKFNYYP